MTLGHAKGLSNRVHCVHSGKVCSILNYSLFKKCYFLDLNSLMATEVNGVKALSVPSYTVCVTLHVDKLLSYQLISIIMQLSYFSIF